MSYQRMLNGDTKPTKDDMAYTIGNNSLLWFEIRKYLQEDYDFTSELVYYGKKIRLDDTLPEKR